MTPARARRPRPAPDLLQLHPATPVPFPPLATERLTLRPFAPADAENLHRLINDFQISRMLSVVPFPYARDLADEWIASTHRRMAEGAGYDLAITGREGDLETLVGAVGLRLLQ